VLFDLANIFLFPSAITVKYIKSVDGFFGCYRGIFPRICQSIVSQTVYKKIASKNPFFGDDGEGMTATEAVLRLGRDTEDIKTMARLTGWEILSVTASTIASQPFYVICVRSMAQFVGRETKYR